MNNNFLISAGVLKLYWSSSNKDTLDLMMPFLMAAICDTTNVNEMIDYSKVTEVFLEEYGYRSFPIYVLKAMLKRLSPNIISKKGGKYYLKKDLSNETDKFKQRKHEFEQKKDQVVESLKKHLERNIRGKEYSNSRVEELLYNFFSEHGLDMARNTDHLQKIRHRDDKEGYEVAKYIIEQNESKSFLFNYINDIMVGFFVSTAISTNSVKALTNSINLKKLSCYLDTRIVINALGLKTKEEEKSAREFIDMLKESGAKILFFQHNLDEVNTILNAYKRSLDPNQYKSSNMTLERLDEECFNKKDVEELQLLLPNKISKLGIKICEKPEYDDSNFVIDERGLNAKLKEKIRYNRYTADRAVECDVDSISSIYRLRKGIKTKKIEDEKYIFITNNSKLYRYSTRYLDEKDDRVHSIMTDIHLASILWLNQPTKHKDFPEMKLIENAVSALQPSTGFIDSFLEQINKLEVSGKLDVDEATLMARDIFCRREMYNMSQGDKSKITDESILELKERVKNEYTKESQEAKDTKLKQLVNEDKQRKRNAYKWIDECGEKKYNQVKRFWNIIHWVSRIALLVVFAMCLAITIKWSSNISVISTIILAVVNVIGFADLIITKSSKIKCIIHNHAYKQAEREKDLKRDEYQEKLGIL